MLAEVKKPHSFQYVRNQAFRGVGKVALVYLVPGCMCIMVKFLGERNSLRCSAMTARLVSETKYWALTFETRRAKCKQPYKS